MKPSVLHYLGSADDRGGIVSIVRALEAERQFECTLGVSPGFAQLRTPPLPTAEFPSMAPERIGLSTFWRARAVADRAASWLGASPGRIFHGHTRAGLLVALRLKRMGLKRVVATVHCYGRQRWFYRRAARQLGPNLFWLSPAMRDYYGAPGAGWEQCLPGCVPENPKPDGRMTKGTGGLESIRHSDFGLPPFSPNLRLGGIGALVPWKCWHLVLDALAALPAELQSRVSFAHVGAGDGSGESQRYREELLTRSAALPGVVWRGEQPSSAALLREIDCLVIASRREPFSVAMLEALNAGVPVLAADSGGATDVIKPPVNGWLFHSGNAADLAAKLALLIDPAKRARTRVDPGTLTRFAAADSARLHREFYQSLIG